MSLSNRCSCVDPTRCHALTDFSRYARREGDQILGQIFVIPACLVLGSVIGLVITSCAAGFYPHEEFGLLWRPYKLMQVIQEQEATSGARAAIFFLSLSFLTSQFCVNVSCSFSPAVCAKRIILTPTLCRPLVARSSARSTYNAFYPNG